MHGRSSAGLNLGECLFFNCGDYDVKSLRPSGIEYKEREAAVSGNQAEFWLLGRHEESLAPGTQHSALGIQSERLA